MNEERTRRCFLAVKVSEGERWPKRGSRRKLAST